jgi:hypothetical protein
LHKGIHLRYHILHIRYYPFNSTFDKYKDRIIQHTRHPIKTLILTPVTFPPFRKK